MATKPTRGKDPTKPSRMVLAQQKMERFALELLTTPNDAYGAYLRAGYRPLGTQRSIDVNVSRLKHHPQVLAILEKHQRKILNKLEVSAAAVLKEAARVAYSNLADLYDDCGAMKPIKDWPEDLQRAVASVEHDKDGRLRKVKLWAKGPAVELLAKHLGLVKDQVHVTGDWDALDARLRSIRKEGPSGVPPAVPPDYMPR